MAGKVEALGENVSGLAMNNKVYLGKRTQIAQTLERIFISHFHDLTKPHPAGDGSYRLHGPRRSLALSL